MSFAALQCCLLEEAESVVAQLIHTGHLCTGDHGGTIQNIRFHVMPGGRALGTAQSWITIMFSAPTSTTSVSTSFGTSLPSQTGIMTYRAQINNSFSLNIELLHKHRVRRRQSCPAPEQFLCVILDSLIKGRFSMPSKL